MKSAQANRRKFIKSSVNSAAGVVVLTALPVKTPAAGNHLRGVSGSLTRLQPSNYERGYRGEARVRFSVIGINHDHIHSQIAAIEKGGGQLVSYYAKEPELSANFAKRYPQAKLARVPKEILEDRSIQLILSSAIPEDRAPLGIEVMQHGKDYMSDKPGIVTLEQLAQVRRVQKQTRRIYSIMYSERLENQATIKAGQLVKDGAIGQVIQTMGVGPHRMNPKARPAWFFDRKHYGGIICDIGSHQFDQFLYFTGSTKAEVVVAQVGNIHHPQYPNFEDFGDVMLRGNGGIGYLRVDWFTPDGLNTWGDARLTILGTDGYIEVRKNVDIAARPGGNHLILVDQKETRYIDSSTVPLLYGTQLVDDILNRTESAMSQEHCFLAAELAIKAQTGAQKINLQK